MEDLEFKLRLRYYLETHWGRSRTFEIEIRRWDDHEHRVVWAQARVICVRSNLDVLEVYGVQTPQAGWTGFTTIDYHERMLNYLIKDEGLPREITNFERMFRIVERGEFPQIPQGV